MDELVEWYRACLDDDEQAAKAATPGPWHADEGMVFAGSGDDAVAAYSDVWDNDGPGADADYLRPEDAAHIARHDPAAVLADIAAKRAVLDLRDLTAGPYDPAAGVLNEAVRTLASAYRHRPGWKDEWIA